MSLAESDRARWEAALDVLAAQATRDADKSGDLDLARVAQKLREAADLMRGDE